MNLSLSRLLFVIKPKAGLFLKRGQKQTLLKTPSRIYAFALGAKRGAIKDW